MSSDAYAYSRYPWKAAIGLRSGGPARFYADLVHQALRYSAPKGGRAAGVRRLLGRRPPSPVALRGAIRVLPRRRREDLEAIALDLFAAWERLTAPLENGAGDPATMDLLALERSSALTVFVFTEGPEPVMVAKFPRAEGSSLDDEVAALRLANGRAGVPRYLGRCRNAHVQEAIRGRALPLKPLRPEECGALTWTAQHEGLFSAVVSLKSATRNDASPVERRPERAVEALAHPSLPSATAAAVEDALVRVGSWSASVLKHGDLSPQNCLFTEDGYSGIVDWEHAVTTGTPGFDTLNAAVAELEHRLALRATHPDGYASGLVTAWAESPFFIDVRRTIASEMSALGLDASDVQPAAIAFFARRLGHRMAAPRGFVSGVEAALTTLVAVCAQERATSE